MSFPLNIEKIMEIAEKFFKCKNARFEVKRFRTRYGLRYIEYGLGFLKKIKIFSYMWGAEIILPRGFKELKSILSVYELKLPEKPKIKDRWDYVLELQIYEKKVGMVKRAIAIRTVMLLLIGAFVENVYPDSGLKFVLAFLPILLLSLIHI